MYFMVIYKIRNFFFFDNRQLKMKKKYIKQYLNLFMDHKVEKNICL